MKSLQAASVTSALVSETMVALKALAIFNSVRLVWVLGHSGTPGNEQADRLARLASLTPYIGPEPALGVSTTTVRNSLKRWSLWEQQRKWNLTSGCRQAKPMLRNYNQSQANYTLRLPKHQLRVLVGFLTGPADLNRHLTLISVRSDALCLLCQEEEEFSLHFLGKCSATMRNRFEIPRRLRDCVCLLALRGCALGPSQWPPRWVSNPPRR